MIMQLLKSHNLYPDLVVMTLEAVPLSSSSVISNECELYLSLSFNQQWYSLLEGRIKLGLKGGQLELRLENTRLQEINAQLDDYLELKTKGSEKEPTWRWELKVNQLNVAKALKRVKLGKIEMLTHPFSVKASWKVCPADITLIDAENLWRHNISPNKHGVLERSIVFFLHQKELPSNLSWIKLGSSEIEKGESGREEPKPALSFQAREELKQLIEQIYSAPTDEMEELVKLTKLNLKSDFAGSNLRAANLRGIDLNRANLKQANLRGVDLSDADLSEANLSYVNLSGADLSGAYLENADLSHGNLHNTSLVVANLIGANLSQANLQGANLTNANLSLAKVAGAKWGENKGLSEQMKQSLIEGGAREIMV